MPSPPRGTVDFLLFTDREDSTGMWERGYDSGYTLSVREAGMYELYMSAARSELGETAFLAAWEEGRAMTEEQAIAIALDNEENDANLKETEPK